MDKDKRLYYLDWLRISAFGLLFLFHAWKPFDHIPFHIKNDEQVALFDILTIFTHGWRMHLIFLISGASTWLAMKSRKDKFVLDRVKRLLVPFIFGILVIIPPQRFYEWTMLKGFQGNYWEFLSVYPGQQLSADIGFGILQWFGHLGTHIWYLPFLFVMTLLSFPVLKKIRRNSLGFEKLKKVMSRGIGAFILVVPMFVCRLLLKPIAWGYTDWADFFVYIWPFIYGFIFMTDREIIEIIKRKMILFLTVGIICSVVFIYLGVSNEHLPQIFLHPGYTWGQLLVSVLSMLIAFSWIMFFYALFARKMDFKHPVLVPANRAILPVYVLHQTIIIIFGYYIIGLQLNAYFKFLLIVMASIPVTVMLYQLIRKYNFTRFLFGMKSRR